ncbi:MAG: CotH kinase family protein, partial [Lachnospiraceae bacterium]|nr:CotH kinase family protein [Lachnospiraceae bacterium]
FFVCEITDNWDSMKNSTFLFKDIEGLVHMGPAWDYDWAYGNINMFNIDTDGKYEWQTTNEYFTNEQYYQSVQWNRYLIRDPYFCMLVYEKYKEEREGAIRTLINSIDEYAELLSEDGPMNDKKWAYTYTKQYYGGRTPENFTKSISSLKSFVKKRVSWMDKQFTDLETLIESLGAYEKDPRINVTNDASTIYVKASLANTETYRLQINGKAFVYVSKE